MARKKVKRYDKGGGVEAEDIVVQGRRPTANAEFSNFDLSRLGGDIGGGMRGGMGDGMGGGMGGGMGVVAPRSLPAPTRSTGPRLTPTAISQPRSTLGRLTGTAAPKGYGVNLKIPFKKGGAVKKMAKGGSTASKRADGCATKGKTKGRFV
jgi:hypothetical protein